MPTVNVMARPLNEFPTPIVSTDWLAAHLGAPRLRVVDASWRMPGKGDARDAYLAAHIPGAVFFPIDEIADRSTGLPHMLPAPAEFERAVGSLGIGERDRIVVYDDAGIFSAARVWWTFRAMGHRDVSVLAGGFPRWRRHHPYTDDIPEVAPAPYRASPDSRYVADDEAVRRAIEDGGAVVLDARPPGRFRGAEPEPRPGLVSGAMPKARNIPHSAVLADGADLKPSAELAAMFAAAGADEGTPVITTCGSGVTAAVLSLALEALGRAPARLYDGAWAEWGRIDNDRTLFPVIAGDAPLGP